MGDDGAANDHLTGYALVMSENFRAKNREINDLKEQVNMGRGAVKVVFWLGAMLGAIYTGIRMFVS